MIGNPPEKVKSSEMVDLFHQNEMDMNGKWCQQLQAETSDELLTLLMKNFLSHN